MSKTAMQAGLGLLLSGLCETLAKRRRMCEKVFCFRRRGCREAIRERRDLLPNVAIQAKLMSVVRSSQ